MGLSTIKEEDERNSIFKKQESNFALNDRYQSIISEPASLYEINKKKFDKIWKEILTVEINSTIK